MFASTALRDCDPGVADMAARMAAHSDPLVEDFVQLVQTGGRMIAQGEGQPLLACVLATPCVLAALLWRCHEHNACACATAVLAALLLLWPQCSKRTGWAPWGLEGYRVTGTELFRAWGCRF